MRSSYRKAFTMIELIVAISIILILIGFLFVAFKSVGGSSKSKATNLSLENAKSMMSEFEGAAGFGRQPSLWWGAPAVVVDPTNVTYSAKGLNFWRVPDRTSADDTGPAVPMPAPGDVSTAGADRNTHCVIANTAIAMSLMQSVSTAKSAIDRAGADQLFLPLWTSGTEYLPMQTVVHRVDVPQNGSGNQGDVGFRCRAQHVAGGGNDPEITSAGPPPVTNAEWTNQGVVGQLLLDGWGNPIIFVPASGLSGVTSGGTPNQTIIGAGNRPFFASAGPDGNFQAGDDNVYSFEN